jgi:hypothetical protein
MGRMGNPGLLREARALVFVLVCVSLSVALHGWAHGHLPTPLALLAGSGLVVPPALMLTGRQRGLWTIAGALAVAQGGLHVVFSLGSSHSMAGASHLVPAATLGTVGSVRPGMMLAAHVVAGALTALWLGAGEDAVWRLARWFARRLVRFALIVRRLPVLIVRRSLVRRDERVVLVTEPRWTRCVVRRGPPVGTAA